MQTSASNIQFFTRQGVYIDTIEADTTRGWILSRLGDCTAIIPLTDPKLRLALIEYGVIVYITNPLTKSWIGVIDTDREWTVGGPKMKAISAEVLLTYRHDLKVDQVKNALMQAEKITGSAGSLIANIIQRINTQEDTLIRPGYIWAGGSTQEETLISDYYTHVSRIASRAGCDFNVTPKISASQIGLNFNLFPPGKKGADKSGFITLEEGVNIMRQETPMIEQGVISNQTIGIGSAVTPTNRLAAIFENSISRRRFGLRQRSVAYPDIKNVDTLKLETQKALGLSAYPSSNPRVTIVDQTLFRRIDEGDIVTFITHTFGFDSGGKLGIKGRVKILGMEINDTTGYMETVVSQVL